MGAQAIYNRVITSVNSLWQVGPFMSKISGQTTDLHGNDLESVLNRNKSTLVEKFNHTKSYKVFNRVR